MVTFEVFGYREVWNKELGRWMQEAHAWSCPLCACVVTDRDQHLRFLHDMDQS